MNLTIWQAKYLATAAVILPVSPLLFLQGQYTRRKVGLLPEAAGEKTGISGEGESPAKLFVIGESTVAGLGARTHEHGSGCDADPPGCARGELAGDDPQADQNRRATRRHAHEPPQDRRAGRKLVC